MTDEITTSALAARLRVTRERIGQLRRAKALSHEPRKIRQGRSHYIYLWPAETRRIVQRGNGRPTKDLTSRK